MTSSTDLAATGETGAAPISMSTGQFTVPLARTRAGEPWSKIRQPLGLNRITFLGVLVSFIFFTAWELVVLAEWVSPPLLPAPHHVLIALCDLMVSECLLSDIGIGIFGVGDIFMIAFAIVVPSAS